MKSNQYTSPWKKALIIALWIIGIALSIIAAIIICEVVEDKYKHFTFWQRDSINDNVYMQRFNDSKSSVRLYNKTEGRYTTPKLDWIVTSPTSGDSLTVFCTHKRKRGFINLNTGHIAISAQYDHAWLFSEGLAAVCQDGQIFFINTEGKEQLRIPGLAVNHLGYCFHGGYCIVAGQSDKCGMIDHSGNLVVDTIYDRIYSLDKENIHIYVQNGLYGLMAVDGAIILPPTYDNIERHDSSLYACKDGIMSIIAPDGKVIQPFVAMGLEPMSFTDAGGIERPTGYQHYYIQEATGVVDKNGKLVIPAIYAHIYHLNEHLFKAELPDNYGWVVIDTHGNIIDCNK